MPSRPVVCHVAGSRGRDAVTSARPAAIVLGGFAGTGKTTPSRRLSREWGLPRLGSDTIERAIRASHGITDDAIDAYYIAYDVLFALCEEFVQAYVSVILDLNLGWAFQWRHLDAISECHPQAIVLPIVLRCPREMCLERTRRRHAADPGYYDPPAVYTTDPKILKVAEFLDQLDRPDVHFIDAARAQDAALRCRTTCR